MSEQGGPAFDVAIVGGGLVGASLALALSDDGARIAVIEPMPFDAADQPSFDERTVALTWSSRLVFESVGIWDHIEAMHAEPILDIHVSNRGHFGMTHLSHRDAGTGALGYVVPTRILGQALHEGIGQRKSITMLCPATARDMEAGDGFATLDLALDHADPASTVDARLVVLADGGRSGLSQAMGGDIRTQAYGQSALLSIVDCDRDHRGRAFERFTPEGPIALLPHSHRRLALVWTTSPEYLEQRLGLDDDDFIAALQGAFGDRAGTFSNPTPRKSYPLQKSRMRQPVGQRSVVIGNAAHTVHPVAGQGFNLGLRDAAVLAKIVKGALDRGEDPGAADLLQRYAGKRKRETFMVSQFTDGLIRLFCSEHMPVQLARNLALFGIELLPPARRFLLRHTMGMADQESFMPER